MARVTGPPTSGNGASSFHLWWHLPTNRPLREVTAVFECLVAPSVEKRYFWALQAGFRDARERYGGAHLGLQWAPEHPGHGAVNWGGYWSGGGELDGTDSPLPGARHTRNTRDYPWLPGRPYRFRIFPTPGREASWRGEVTDLETGTVTVVRDLRCPGDRLTAPVVWTECFADCDHPSAAVRWSELAATTHDGEVVTPGSVRVTFQPHERGGCANTNVLLDGTGVVQVTNTSRVLPDGATVLL